MDSRFGSIPGVVKTTVGYTGGTTLNPDYRHIGDHSEAVRVEYDSEQIAYADLLEVFWQSHDPTYAYFVRQYRNAIFPLDEKQMTAARRSRDELASNLKGEITTVIEPAGPFYPAEDYHQKYLLRKAEAIYRELKAIYPDEKDFADSTAAAKINGYLGCNGNPKKMAEEIDSFGLSREMRQRLLEFVTTSCKDFGGLSCPVPKKE